jgi:hypothetical protein
MLMYKQEMNSNQEQGFNGIAWLFASGILKYNSFANEKIKPDLRLSEW